MNEKLRALNRFGLGARFGEVDELRAPRLWLHDQVDAGRADSAALERMPLLDEIGGAVVALRTAQRDREQDAIAEARRRLRDILTMESLAVLTQRVHTRTPFVERLVAFWSNHLCASAVAGLQVAGFTGHYERVAIRPHVLGRFEEMVLASAKHPAMLMFLNNFQSIGPGSMAGRRSARGGNARGLNENYARELLELHTLGVDGGYGQEDVEALARILTGWTLSGIGPGSGEGSPGGFVFRPALHEPGEKVVLGRRYGSGRSTPMQPGPGVQEGEDAIRDLCRHPATARFIATKLVRHFVSDDPPDGAVVRVAEVFRATRGDLGEVAHAIVELDEAWRTPRGKFRTPQEWLVAVLRAFRADEVDERAPVVLARLGHGLWAPPSPKGFEDTQGPWSDPDALMNRAELARTVARVLPGRDPRVVLEVVDVNADDPLHALLEDTSISARDRLALAIGGPAFQWR